MVPLIVESVDRGSGAAQPQHEHSVLPSRCVDGQRTASPFIEARHGFDLRQLEAKRRARRRLRQHLQRDFADHAQDTERADEQP